LDRERYALEGPVRIPAPESLVRDLGLLPSRLRRDRQVGAQRAVELSDASEVGLDQRARGDAALAQRLRGLMDGELRPLAHRFIPPGCAAPGTARRGGRGRSPAWPQPDRTGAPRRPA